jgi:hypothetical protein
VEGGGGRGEGDEGGSAFREAMATNNPSHPALARLENLMM